MPEKAPESGLTPDARRVLAILHAFEITGLTPADPAAANRCSYLWSPAPVWAVEAVASVAGPWDRFFEEAVRVLIRLGLVADAVAADPVVPPWPRGMKAAGVRLGVCCWGGPRYDVLVNGELWRWVHSGDKHGLTLTAEGLRLSAPEAARRNRGGRPRQYDPAADAPIYGEWQSKRGKMSQEDFAASKGMTGKELRRLIDRYVKHLRKLQS